MKNSDLTVNLVLGVLSSIAASALLYYGAVLHERNGLTSVVILTLLVLSVTALIAVLLRLRARSIPGLERWATDRSSANYSYRLLSEAQHSFEYMGATGSSTFVQSGRFLGLLADKYRLNRSFTTHVLLMDPDAKDLIEYRRNSIGSDPNVCNQDDILGTIRLLSLMKEQLNITMPECFEVRTYANEIVWHIVIIDRSKAILGMYGPGASGWKWPYLVFNREPRSFYFAIEEQFDQRWRSSRPTPMSKQP